jgi:ABC-2 type transport system permease protein
VKAVGVTPFRSGVNGGLIELRQSFSGTALIGQVLWPGATLVALFFLRNREFETSSFTLGSLLLPGALGMFVAFGMMLMARRESGSRVARRRERALQRTG